MTPKKSSLRPGPSARDVRVILDMEPQQPPGPSTGGFHAYSRGSDHSARGQRSRPQLFHEQEPTPAKIDAVQRAIDRKRLGQLRRARTEVALVVRDPTIRKHLVDPLGGLERPQQHCHAVAGLAAYDVEAMVHPIGQIHIGMAAGQIH